MQSGLASVTENHRKAECQDIALGLAITAGYRTLRAGQEACAPRGFSA